MQPGLVGVEQPRVGWLEPDCASARLHATAESHRANVQLAPARHVGTGTTRSHASVITPSAPSEPTSRRSGSGPAPLDGWRCVAIAPAGVTTVSACARSSIRVGPVA
jgi:hypothetical protein